MNMLKSCTLFRMDLKQIIQELDVCAECATARFYHAETSRQPPDIRIHNAECTQRRGRKPMSAVAKKQILSAMKKGWAERKREQKRAA